jgi:peptide/nickel transport system permease protein
MVRGNLDALLMRATDAALSIPRLFLALCLAALWGGSLTTTVVVLGLTSWMGAARLVRGEVLSARERDYVRAAQASGARATAIAFRHLLPAAAGVLAAEAACAWGAPCSWRPRCPSSVWGCRLPRRRGGTCWRTGATAWGPRPGSPPCRGLLLALTVAAVARLSEPFGDEVRSP